MFNLTGLLYRGQILVRMTVLILARKPNTDGIGNCLQQPGQILNQLEKSMRETTSQLIKFCVP